MNPTLSLTGKTALITGARRGIGKAVALAFAEAGADVAIIDVSSDDQLSQVIWHIENRGRKSLGIQVDIRKKNDLEAAVRAVANKLGGIDILFNSAAVMIRKPLHQISEEEWDTVMDTNLKGTFFCSQVVSSIMKWQHRGVIISVASEQAFKGFAGRGAYPISKAGVLMLTRVLALELAPFNIRVNAIAPGFIKTEMNRTLWENRTELKNLEASIPLGRVGETSDIVGLALFLASEASAYITGQTILIDGGRLS